MCFDFACILAGNDNFRSALSVVMEGVQEQFGCECHSVPPTRSGTRTALSSAPSWGSVGVLVAENFKFSVLAGTDSQENTAFHLGLWGRLPRFNNGTKIIGVWFE